MTPPPADSGGRRPGKDSLRVIAGPLLAYFDKRFQQVYDRIDDRMNELYGRVATEVETMSEMTLVMQRFVDVAGDQADDVVTRMTELCDSLERRDPATANPADAAVSLESAFVMAAVGRLEPRAKILNVATKAVEPGRSDTLAALGYEVATLDRADGPLPTLDPGAPYDCAVWSPADQDQHGVDLLRKSLGVGGELVMSLRHSDVVSDFVDDCLRDWSVVERRLLAHTGERWQPVDAVAPDPGATVVELVRALPRT